MVLFRGYSWPGVWVHICIYVCVYMITSIIENIFFLLVRGREETKPNIHFYSSCCLRPAAVEAQGFQKEEEC